MAFEEFVDVKELKNSQNSFGPVMYVTGMRP